MAVVVTVAKGYDLGYIWKTQGEAAGRATGGYYISAARAGEPPGRWWGPGAQALGLTPGQIVQRTPYDAVYRQIDPRTGAELGRARGRYATVADHLARLQAAEPHATAERLMELEREAAQATRQPAVYIDVTVSFSKSISVLHASLRENERRARLAGDQQAAGYWAGREQAFQEILHRANRAALEYLQDWAGVTRTGYHGTRIGGREPGRFELAGLIVTSWLQGTSRDGDPQDHVHNQIARITRTFRDGKWRALDTMSVRGVLGALQAIAATAVECELTAEFGVAWVPRADGRGNEIAGVTQAQMDAYSTRTVQVHEKERELARVWECKHGRAPNSRELLYIANDATLQSRKGKDAGAVDWDALAARWDATIGGELADTAQLTLEDRLLAHAQTRGAPRLPGDLAARRLGADPALLEAELRGRPHGAREQPAPRGLRLDQAAAVWHVLTSARTVEIVTGPAGTGKTWVLATAAGAWDGPVFGTATSQNATNELRAAGVQVAANTTRLLADLTEGRIPPGSLILADEGSMISITRLVAIVSYAARNGCKLVLAGDQEQLAAVEGGGAMMLLAGRLGYVQLAEPVRFTAAWERGASLRLRAGDATALDEYDQHGRIRSAPPDQAIDQAARAYVASSLDGRDVLLMAADWARCRELSARIREDLIHLGLVDDGRTIRIAEGVQASVGDLIICRRNDHGIEAGESGRALANGDVLRIEAITRGGIIVRRRLDPDRATGQRRFTTQAFRYDGYRSCDLAYAVTGHSAQGATVHTGIALVTGTEDRQWLYPAMTRGTDMNVAFVFTTPVRAADPQPGTRPAPELGRYDRLRREHAGYPPGLPGAAVPDALGLREPVAVLADVLGRDGAELSASETRQRNLANADHLGVLHAIWTAETTAARDDRYRDLVLAALPAGHRQDLSGQARWLFRTLRGAELADLDPAEVIRTAIASRDLAGARDIAAVLDSRISPRIDPLLPQPQGPWASRIPRLPDPARQAHLAEVAVMMDGRTQRLGQHAARTGPAWAVAALGPVPADEAGRRVWQTKAASIGAYRETYGYGHPADPIGPEPSRETPDQRAAWHQAFAALGSPGQPNVRAMADGRLWLLRDTYTTETAWAPPYVGKELRLSRLGAFDAALGAIRAAAEAAAARKADDHHRAERQETLAASYRALRDLYQQREHTLAQAMADRQDWEHATAASRHLAIAADTELRRRHPGQTIEPLLSGEPAPASDTGRDGKLSETATRIRDLAAQHQAFRERTGQRQRRMTPREDPGWAALGDTLPSWWAPRPDGILRPPKPEITPSAKILQLAAEQDIELEAGG